MAAIQSPFKTFVSYPLQAVLTLFLYGLFRLLPLNLASALGGRMGRLAGPLLSVTRRARANLTMAFPEKDKAEIEHILGGMWENLGRTAAEIPHIAAIDTTAPSGPVEVIGTDVLERIRDSGEASIFFSAHMANWELPPAVTTQRQMRAVLVYRAANNPLVDWLYQRRTGHANTIVAPKGSQGAKILFRSIKDKRALGLLVDQKMNDGIAVPFFGRDAMTAPAVAELALRFDCPLVPIHVVRRGGARFQVIAEEPLQIEKTGDRGRDVMAVMKQVNERIESWIREHPEQWLWVHNRWPD